MDNNYKFTINSWWSMYNDPKFLATVKLYDNYDMCQYVKQCYPELNIIANNRLWLLIAILLYKIEPSFKLNDCDLIQKIFNEPYQGDENNDKDMIFNNDKNYTLTMTNWSRIYNEPEFLKLAKENKQGDMCRYIKLRYQLAEIPNKIIWKFMQMIAEANRMNDNDYIKTANNDEICHIFIGPYVGKEIEIKEALEYDRRHSISN